MFQSRIKIHLLNTESDSNLKYSFLIFDSDQSNYLKESKRICLRKIGDWCISSINNQSIQPSPPFQLALEEVCLLIDLFEQEVCLEKNIYPNLQSVELIDEFQQLKTEYNSYLENLNSSQIEKFKTTRRQQMLSKKDQILEGKRKKLIAQMTQIESNMQRSTLSGEEIDKLKLQKNDLEYNLENLELIFLKDLEKMNKSDLVFNEIELFLKTPDFYEKFFKREMIPIKEFKLLNRDFMNTCKYTTFKFLYSQGYYLTSGAKFGGDFLVYPGDPVNFHSQFILVCFDDLNEYNKLTLKQLITYARMATTVKKTFLISLLTLDNLSNRCCSILLNDSKSYLNFLSLNWSHI
ncbi:unnamed protein product [Brachionus calyciflorus]|uniref:tRNA-intron lyase n=1 Tax=Brachionus calyciflorus TaxID=104777 RepID=A0A813M7V5_9BILA|nr:unnamed protein product [Brachionus calyciflorus]